MKFLELPRSVASHIRTTNDDETTIRLLQFHFCQYVRGLCPPFLPKLAFAPTKRHAQPPLRGSECEKRSLPSADLVSSGRFFF